MIYALAAIALAVVAFLAVRVFSNLIHHASSSLDDHR